MQIWNGSDEYCWRYRADTILSTDGQTDKVKPVYPPFNFVEADGITRQTRCIALELWVHTYPTLHFSLRNHHDMTVAIPSNHSLDNTGFALWSLKRCSFGRYCIKQEVQKITAPLAGQDQKINIGWAGPFQIMICLSTLHLTTKFQAIMSFSHVS